MSGISRKSGLIIFFTLLVLGVSFFIFDNTSVPTARAWDIKWGYYAILLTFIAFIVGIVLNGKDFVCRVREHLPSGKSLIALVALLLFFVIFSLNHIENSHRVLSDETSWESMGLQMRFAHSGGICNEGIWNDGNLDCKVEVNNFKGKALGFLYSIVFLVASPDRDTALKVNLPLYVLSLIAFFLALSIWFKNDWLALAATAFLGGMPIYLLQARSASTEVLYIALLALIMAWYALVPPKDVNWKHFWITVPLLGLFAQTRQETIFAFIPFALYYYRYFLEKVYRLPLFSLAVIFVSWPSVNTMAAYRGYDFQGGSHAAHSLDNLIFNFKSNLSVMLNMEEDPSFGGILKNPFYTSFTIILLAATAWLLFRLITNRKYVRGFILGILFCIQIFVILLNVSGTFDIDINQRYVLVALPLFAIIMALGIKDFLQTYFVTEKRAALITVVLAALLSVGLAVYHEASFASNMLYYRNKLLGEEHYLNTYLKQFPKNSIFIYSRPWQMLASGHSSFSERTFMGWTTDDFAKWFNVSGGNIYLVRGQDGYGNVDRNSRVVGFKTTDQIQSILDGYRVEKILVENRLFGYPLTVHKILSKRGVSLYAQGLSVGNLEKNQFVLKKNFPESVAYDVFLGDSLLAHQSFDAKLDTFPIETSLPGLSRFQFAFYVPDDTVRVVRDVFTENSTVLLLSAYPMASASQGWGDPQINESVEHHTLQVGGEAYRFGIGSHAPSVITFDLNASYVMLNAVVGLDEESACGDGADFSVKADGKEVWHSKWLYSGDAEKVSVKISGARRLELLAGEGGNKDCDHADWADIWLSGGAK